MFGSYCSLTLMNETLNLINVLLRSENDLIIQLFLDFRLVKVLIDLFDISFEDNSRGIEANITITKIIGHLFYGKASQAEVKT